MLQEGIAPDPSAVSNTPLRPIAATKLRPPRGARHLMQRDALIARLLEVRRHRCVMVMGPAGSGKTSTLLAYRKALLSFDFDVAWVSFVEEDNEPGRFLECLLASLAEVDRELVREVLPLIERGDAATEHYIITLVQGLSRHRRELVLMLEDLHQLDAPAIFQALQWLLEYAPPQLHIVLGSRSALPLSLRRLRAQGQLAEFDMRDLRFTPEESERFLREHLGTIDKRDAQVLHELTDGWVAGLQLFVVDMKTKRSGEVSYAHVKVRDPRAFAEYFEREVLVRLPADDVDLLVRMAACNRFSASLCASLLGHPQAVARMMRRLSGLDSDNLFITQIQTADREIWYRMHPLLREVLAARMAAWPERERHALHTAAWHWFNAHGHVDEAVRHAVRAGDTSAAAKLVESCVDELISQGDLGLLHGLLRRLEPAQLAASFALTLAQGYIHLYARNFEGVRECVQKLGAKREDLTPGNRYALVVLEAGQALQLDDPEAIEPLADALYDVPPDVTDMHWIGGRNVLSWMHMHRGEYEQALSVLEPGNRIIGAPRSTLLGRCMRGICMVIEGHVTQAEQVAREVLYEAELLGRPYVGIACKAAALLVSTLYEANDLQGVCDVLERRMDTLERVSIPDTVLRALMALAAAHRALGRELEARACLDRLEDYAGRYGLDRLTASALLMRMLFNLRHGEIDQAHTTLSRLEALAAGRADGRPAVTDTVYCAEQARVNLAIHTRDLGGAHARLDAMIATAETHGRWRRAAGLRLQQALVEQALGHADAAQAQALEAVRLGHRLGLVRALLDVSPQIPRMLAALAETPGFDPVLAFYCRRVCDSAAQLAEQLAPSADNALAASGNATDALSDRERDVLALVAQAMSNKKIAQALNVSPETVKWHLKNIYGKLRVAGRDEAVARARDMAVSLGQPGH